MFIIQVWYTKNCNRYREDEDVIIKENNYLDPDYVDHMISIEPSELHNWNKPKIVEVKDGTVHGVEVAPGWRHFKSYELDMLVHEMPDKIEYEVWNDAECLIEDTVNKKDYGIFNFDIWVRHVFLDNYESFNEYDEMFKEYSDYNVEDEIFDLLRKYRDDPSSWSGKNALFNAGCLAKRKLCESAIFYNKDEWEVTDCPEDIEDLHFCLVTLRV